MQAQARLAIGLDDRMNGDGEGSRSFCYRAGRDPLTAFYGRRDLALFDMERSIGLDYFFTGGGRDPFWNKSKGAIPYGIASLHALQLILFFYILKFIHLQCILQCHL
ncbi:hypothetical protein QUB63_24420 [Microcoleus sp. ARI1-B5]|uniref:hypothetical protein n=1 Tax=unclassified Microcoleus TaxID=2642155 RepID=UPI002FD0A3B1